MRRCWISNVNGPNDYPERKHLWSELSSLYAYCEIPWCIGEDFIQYYTLDLRESIVWKTKLGDDGLKSLLDQ